MLWQKRGEHFFSGKKESFWSTSFYGRGKEYFSQFKDPPVFDSTKVANTYAEKKLFFRDPLRCRPSCTFSHHPETERNTKCAAGMSKSHIRRPPFYGVIIYRWFLGFGCCEHVPILYSAQLEKKRNIAGAHSKHKGRHNNKAQESGRAG